ncbi:MAG: 6-phosphofructokinase [Acidobacteria bacterium]|jgi:6-phosphofructokinase 1|nr:6-phosphofructokinase [Acidobacteriota bacterium]
MSSAPEPANALGVITSGGDSPGMNAAVRAVVRSALLRGVPVFAVLDGYEGLVAGGDRIRALRWEDVGGIIQRGGTIIGTARSKEFRTREGRLLAARHLVEHRIDRLVVIGGDGSLTGANLFRREWPSLLDELARRGDIDRSEVERYQYLALVGLVGSIDNDMVGTDMTIGADTAMHRITDAIDALASTASSHQRAFVVEVMGRNCGYLALMGAIAGGADYVLLPECPPADGWEDELASLVTRGRAAGRRDCIVVVAEGACDRHGTRITTDYVRQTLQDRLGEDTRSTILGHVQRGGSPSAFDRWMSTLVGAAAADEVLGANFDTGPKLIGLRFNRVMRAPLMASVELTHDVGTHIANGRYDEAMRLRGNSFNEMLQTFNALSRALPSSTPPPTRRRIAVMHGDGPAPGMNTAVRAAVRLGLDAGHTMLGVSDGIEGLMEGRVRVLDWRSVDGWNASGGAELGTSRWVPSAAAVEQIALQLAAHDVHALLVIGGWSGYEAMDVLARAREHYPLLAMPVVCVPATINNDLPHSELAIGADTALNSIVEALDRLKQSAVAVNRCFLVEVMGRYCGYLAAMSALASGAERIYLHERGITLDELRADVVRMRAEFSAGKRLSLVVRNEHAHPQYTTDFITRLFEAESAEVFDVRRVVLGHIQQGGNPTPFDRIHAARFAARAMAMIDQALERGDTAVRCLGVVEGQLTSRNLADALATCDRHTRRPRKQWWLDLAPMAERLA